MHLLVTDMLAQNIQLQVHTHRHITVHIAHLSHRLGCGYNNNDNNKITSTARVLPWRNRHRHRHHDHTLYCRSVFITRVFICFLISAKNQNCNVYCMFQKPVPRMI
ncbi:uncharacterized protein HMPREF1120_03188 [Exophiala dermatitidis NIH/UT8656]|uniref:Uncharacterized protein n=1 Tax=Exophiala dermatitidis (strain ATCC 34100 / CBS 525.76 / NIH/UT8656) TaxID=858893 RepID=H6BVH3_EXODN|nr:uncharacterized protein HMPREF1120_03188 [Exophiala dermatitidis NIH/UT8656]EHY55032.1 hypothetical protein HMPREF1120_03188 [Exophiala dermatitidis NIH/UT8656]